MTKKLIVLAGIVLLSVALRTYKLSDRPAGFTWDEAALGYNAYSLLKTGKDEYNQRLPIVFKSFGDYKPGLYVYLTVPSVALLGLNEFATRLPSTIAGVLMVITIYILTRQVVSAKAAPFVAVIAAINPWSIQFSRGAWEANWAIFLATLGTVLFIRKKWYLAMLFFGLTFWTYQGAKLFTPLLLLGLILTFRIQISKLIKPGIILAILLLPIVLGLKTQSGRLRVFSVFSYSRSVEESQAIIDQDATPLPSLSYTLFHTKVSDQLRGVLQRYVNHYSPYYLFFAGDWTSMRHTTIYYGYAHIPEIVTIIVGLAVLARSRTSGAKLLGWWFIIAAIPSALSRDLVSGVRSLPLMVPLIVTSGVGLSALATRKWLGLLMGLLLIGSVGYYLDLFFNHHPEFGAREWLYPYKNSYQIVQDQYNNYERIVFTNKFGQPYMFALFYLKIDPTTYQKQSHLTEDPGGDVGEVKSFEKFEFRPIFWPKDRGLTSTLFVGGEYELPTQDLDTTENMTKIADVLYPNGAHALRIVGIK